MILRIFLIIGDLSLGDSYRINFYKKKVCTHCSTRVFVRSKLSEIMSTMWHEILIEEKREGEKRWALSARNPLFFSILLPLLALGTVQNLPGTQAWVLGNLTVEKKTLATLFHRLKTVLAPTFLASKNVLAPIFETSNKVLATEKLLAPLSFPHLNSPE